jgi:hypothetical protein
MVKFLLINVRPKLKIWTITQNYPNWFLQNYFKSIFSRDLNARQARHEIYFLHQCGKSIYNCRIAPPCMRLSNCHSWTWIIILSKEKKVTCINYLFTFDCICALLVQWSVSYCSNIQVKLPLIIVLFDIFCLVTCLILFILSHNSLFGLEQDKWGFSCPIIAAPSFGLIW